MLFGGKCLYHVIISLWINKSITDTCSLTLNQSVSPLQHIKLFQIPQPIYGRLAPEHYTPHDSKSNNTMTMELIEYNNVQSSADDVIIIFEVNIAQLELLLCKPAILNPFIFYFLVFFFLKSYTLKKTPKYQLSRRKKITENICKEAFS